MCESIHSARCGRAHGNYQREATRCIVHLCLDFLYRSRMTVLELYTSFEMTLFPNRKAY